MNFYREAACLIDRIEAKEGSIKSCLATVDEKSRKRTAALVIETLKYRPALASVIEESGLLKYEKRTLTPSLALVFVHDLLLTKGIQASDGPLKQSVMRHKTRLQAEWTKLKVKKGVRLNEDLAQAEDIRADQIPRYVRVNLNMWSVDEAISDLQARGFERVTHQKPTGREFAVDPHIVDLLIFHHSVSFQGDANYDAGKFILQDKASCFPSTVLAPPTHATVIDATSAPGNKTSHLSALMGNTGKIFAFERDKKRYETLKSMLKKAGCRNTEPIHADFLRIDPEDAKFAAVTHILVDPSCSGSGIVSRLDYLVENSKEDGEVEGERLQKLASFQLLMIRHAMKFKHVTKIVYSTCSIHPQENEHVVRQALDSPGQGRFILAPKSLVLPGWQRRGITAEFQGGDAMSLVRCSPGEDATNGFFVACFIRAIPSFPAPSEAGVGPNPTGDRTSLPGKRKLRDEDPKDSPPDHEEGRGRRGVDEAPSSIKRRKGQKKHKRTKFMPSI